MISFWRRIIVFKSNQIPSTSKKLHTKFLDFSDGIISTKEIKKGSRGNNGHRILEVKENIRILLISDDQASSSGCAIRVDVGSEDDEKYNGLSHFLEHIICNLTEKTDGVVRGDTFLYNTVYNFGQFKIDNCFWKCLASISKLMFSPDPIDDYEKEQFKNVIHIERLRVDGECYTKLKEHSSNNRLEQIFKMKDIKMPKFGFGNFESLPKNGHVKDELEKCRKLYRERPVFVCICSKMLLDDMQTSMQNNFWICKTYTEQDQQRKPRKSIDLKPSKIDSDKRLFVVKSAADLLQLRIQFPFNRTYNTWEDNTFSIFIRTPDITSKLRDFLFQKNIVTTSVVGQGTTLFGYCLLIDLVEWETNIVQHPPYNGVIQKGCHAKNSFFRRILIAQKTDVITDKLEERKFFMLVGNSAAKNLLKEEIMGNKNILFAIVTRQTERVIKNIIKEAESIPQPEREPIFQTQFNSFPNNLYKDSVNTDSAKCVECFVNTIKEESKRETVLIEDSTFLAYKSLLVAELGIRNPKFRNHKFLFRGDHEYLNINGKRSTSLREFTNKNALQSCEIENFEFIKKYKMRILSIQLTDPKMLTKSLLAAAIQNKYGQDKIDPIPMQYNTLIQMDSENYEHNIRKCMSEDQNNNQNNNRRLKLEKNTNDRAKQKFSIKSINKSELITGTLYFFKSNLTPTPELDKLVHSVKELACISLRKIGYYTPISYAVNIGDTQGVVVEVYTMENQLKNDTVPNEIETAMNDIVIQKYELKKTLEEIQRSTICIQIVGQQKIEPMNTTFNEEFEHWRIKHQNVFNHILNPFTSDL